MQEKTVNKNHNFIMENRNKLVLTGVKNVDSFNETEVVVFTELGELKIKGKNIFISKVNTDSGELEMTGNIESAQYGNNTDRVPNNFITKLFR